MSNTILADPATRPTPASDTHEAFIHAVRAIVLLRVADDTHRARLADAKLVYGAGHGMGARGVTFYGAWANGTPGHESVRASPPGLRRPLVTIHQPPPRLALLRRSRTFLEVLWRRRVAPGDASQGRARSRGQREMFEQEVAAASGGSTAGVFGLFNPPRRRCWR